MLDTAGLPQCKIVASNALDEYLIGTLISQEACIDSFGVGERLITSRSEPVFGGVYKLCAIEEADGTIIPKIKISENQAKINNPAYKKVYRLYDNTNGKAGADLICLHDEVIDENLPLELFDPDAVWKRKIIKNYTAVELLKPIFIAGKCVYQLPKIDEIRIYCQQQLDTLWDEVKRFDNPQHYYVDLSQKLWDVKHELIMKHR